MITSGRLLSRTLPPIVYKFASPKRARIAFISFWFLHSSKASSNMMHLCMELLDKYDCLSGSSINTSHWSLRPRLAMSRSNLTALESCLRKIADLVASWNAIVVNNLFVFCKLISSLEEKKFPTNRLLFSHVSATVLLRVVLPLPASPFSHSIGGASQSFVHISLYLREDPS